MVGAEPVGLIGEKRRHARTNRKARLKLDSMALPVVKPHGLNPLISEQRPSEAGGGILPAGKQHQGGGR
jgi:hypothetical protein